MAVTLTSANVPKAPIAPDPGVRPPPGAFEDTPGIAATELLPAAEKFAEVAIQQENRRDTVSRSKSINSFNRSISDEFRRVNAEEDFSDNEVAASFGKFMSEQEQSLLKAHEESGASPASMARAQVRLQDIKATMQGKAAVVSATLGRQAVLTQFDDALKGSIDRINTDFSEQSINDELLQARIMTDDVKGDFDPSEEEELFAAYTNGVAISAIDAHLGRGDFAGADHLLDTTLQGVLSPAELLNQRRKIGVATGAKTNLERELDFINTTLIEQGKPPLTMEQFNQKVGIGNADKRRTKQVFLPSEGPNGTTITVFDDGVGGFFNLQNEAIDLPEDARVFDSSESTTKLPAQTRDKFLNVQIATRNLIGGVQDALDLLETNPDVNTLTASAAAFTNDMQQEGMAIARALGKTFEPDIFEPEKYSSTFDTLGVKNREFQSILISLAFQAAAASGQTTRSVSDRDVVRFLTEIGEVSEDPRGIAVAMRGLVKRTKRNLENTFLVLSPDTPIPQLPELKSSFFEEDGRPVAKEEDTVGISADIPIDRVDFSHMPKGMSKATFLKKLRGMSPENQELFLLEEGQ